jgi:ADP-ribose pyrophosphatase
VNVTEKTLSEEVIYDGKIIKVRKDTAELPNGNHAAREVVEHSGGVCVLPLTDDNHVIMVEQFRYPYKKVLTEIPAGKREKDEPPIECAKRELLEETGCTAKSLEPLGELYPTPAYCTEVIYMYLARGLCEGENNLDEDEFLNVVKIPFSKAVDMVIRNEISDAKTQLALLKTKIMLNI